MKNGNSNSNSNININSTTAGTGGVIKNYHLRQELTNYLYDGNSLLSEYNGATGETFAQYYRGADDQVVSRKMFGFQGRKDQGYLGNLRDRGHHLFYHYDGMGNVTDLTGKSYDIKESLMDYSAGWYSPLVGRFTTQNTRTGRSPADIKPLCVRPEQPDQHHTTRAAMRWPTPTDGATVEDATTSGPSHTKKWAILLHKRIANQAPSLEVYQKIISQPDHKTTNRVVSALLEEVL